MIGCINATWGGDEQQPIVCILDEAFADMADLGKAEEIGLVFAGFPKDQYQRREWISKVP